MSRLVSTAAAAAILLWSGPSLADPPMSNASAQGPAAGTAQNRPECYCRAQGKMFALGESACLKTSEGPRIAQCGMVLNNTSWRFTTQACPET
jgi:hypothetical protein